jgi:hypothetical protein
MNYVGQVRIGFYSSLNLLVIFCSPSTGVAQSRSPAPHTDTQSWNDLQVTVPLNKEIDMILLGTLRIGRSVTHPVDERVGVNFRFNVGKYLTWTPGYLYIRMQPVAGRNDRENRFSFAATPRIPFKRFTLTDRNLFERRIRSPQVDATRYRNRLQIELPIKRQNSKWLFFASDEIFYDWSVTDWVRNRFAVGVRKTFSKKFAVDFYYLRQNDGRTRPGDLNVIGTVFRLSP